MYASQQIKSNGCWIDYGFLEEVPQYIPSEPPMGVSFNKPAMVLIWPKQEIVDAIPNMHSTPLDMCSVQGSFTEKLHALILFRAGMVIKSVSL